MTHKIDWPDLVPWARDAVVAEHVLDWHYDPHGNIVKADGQTVVLDWGAQAHGHSVAEALFGLAFKGIPYHSRYTRDIDAAWSVVKHVRENCRDIVLHDMAEHLMDTTHLDHERDSPYYGVLWFLREATPEGICRAALQAKGVEVVHDG